MREEEDWFLTMDVGISIKTEFPDALNENSDANPDVEAVNSTLCKVPSNVA